MCSSKSLLDCQWVLTIARKGQIPEHNVLAQSNTYQDCYLSCAFGRTLSVPRREKPKASWRTQNSTDSISLAYAHSTWCGHVCCHPIRTAYLSRIHVSLSLSITRHTIVNRVEWGKMPPLRENCKLTRTRQCCACFLCDLWQVWE